MRRFAIPCLLFLLGLMGYNCLLCSQMLSLLRARPAPTVAHVGGSGVSASVAPARQETPDIRERLLSSFRHTDKDFVQDADVYQLTHFSYLGALTTQQGKVYVCEAKWVLPGMQAPRGVSCIVFSDRHLRYLGKIRFEKNGPLWCEQGKLYLFGEIDVSENPTWSDCPPLSEPYRGGNVIDVSQGFDGMRIYHEKKYGSSGGVSDP